MVCNGWTIANRIAITKLIGKDEFSKLGKAYESLSKRDGTIPNLARTGQKIWIPSGEISLKMSSDKQYLLSFPAKIGDFNVNKNTQSFRGKDINIKTITARIKAFEKKVVDYFKMQKNCQNLHLSQKL